MNMLTYPSKAYYYAAGYVLSVVLANLTLHIFVTLPVLGVFTFGTLFFAFTFTFRDRVHHLANSKSFVYATIGVTVIANIIAAYLTGTPWRFIIASFIAIAIAETADTEVFHALRKRTWLTRVLSSNAVAVPIDTAIFVTIAFYGNETTKIMWQIFQNDVLWKFAIATVVAVNISKRSKHAYS
jgi:uncharacterized PurR-regulated membrane protein YhhQ (DUF165 family)